MRGFEIRFSTDVLRDHGKQMALDVLRVKLGGVGRATRRPPAPTAQPGGWKLSQRRVAGICAAVLGLALAEMSTAAAGPEAARSIPAISTASPLVTFPGVLASAALVLMAWLRHEH